MLWAHTKDRVRRGHTAAIKGKLEQALGHCRLSLSMVCLLLIFECLEWSPGIYLPIQLLANITGLT